MAIPFLFMIFAGMDLGRYFITQHSLRTLVSEAVRSAVIHCSDRGACDYATAVPSPSAVWAQAPFLNSAAPDATLTASQTLEIATGVRTVTATASYGFSFILPAWHSLNGTMTETSVRKY